MDLAFFWGQTVPNWLMALAAMGAAVVFWWRKWDKKEAQQLREQDKAQAEKYRNEDKESYSAELAAERAERERVRQEDLDRLEEQRNADLANAQDSRNERIASGIRARWIIVKEGSLYKTANRWGLEIVNLNEFSASNLEIECTKQSNPLRFTLKELPPGRFYVGSERNGHTWEMAHLVSDNEVEDVVTSPGWRVTQISFVYGKRKFERSELLVPTVQELVEAA